MLRNAEPERPWFAHGGLVCGVLATEHIGALAAILLFSTALVAGARLRPGAWTATAAGALALVLAGAEVGWWIYLVTKESTRSEVATALPLQLCDAAVFVAALALLLRQQLLVEITYFWALAGSLQALITPDLPQHLPSFAFFQYYVAHGGVVAAALFLVVGLRQLPRRGAVVRVAGITIAYVLVVGAVDAATGANYMYLRNKPPTASLFDLMGPWPWYVAWAALLGVALLVILDAPFRFLRLRDASRA
jgi:hypothetical integral membrane protein (TIGR02206 family)